MYTVLFAEDTPDTRKLCCGILRRLDTVFWKLKTAPRPLSMARAHAGSIDLLITDIAMPRMSSVSLRRAFANCHPETPVLFISGNPGSPVVGDPLLAKPFTPAELMSRVKGLMGFKPTSAVAAVFPISSDHEGV